MENKVGYIRRNFLTPPPVIDDFDEANLKLTARLKEDLKRPHYRKQVLHKYSVGKVSRPI